MSYTSDKQVLIHGEEATFQNVQLVLPNGTDGQTTTDPRHATTETETETKPETETKTSQAAARSQPEDPIRRTDVTPVTTITPTTTQLQPLTCRKVLGLTLVLISSVLYCLSIGIAKQTPGIRSPEICCVQCSVCLGALVIILTYLGGSFTVPRSKVLMLTLVSGSGAAGLFLTVYSVQHMRFGDAVLFLYTAPLFSGLFAKIVFREKCGVVNFTSAFACFLGIVFTLQPPVIFTKMSHDDSNLSLTNCVLAVLGAVSLGVCYTAVRVQGTEVSLLATLFWINFTLLPTSMVVQLITAQPYAAPHCGPHRLYLPLSGLLMLLSLYLFFRALSRDVTTPAVLMRNTDVVLGYCLQAWWFKEDVDVLNVIGLIMITGGVSAVFLHKLLKNASFNFRSLKYNQLEEEDTETLTA